MLALSLQRDDLDNKHRGKALRYCKAMLEANPARPFAICLLTNTEVLEGELGASRAWLTALHACLVC